MYAPEVMGEFGATMSFVQILAIFATGQYFWAAVGETDQERVNDIVALSLILNALFFVCLTLVLLVTGRPVLISVIVLFYNMSEIFKLRSYRFGELNRANISTFLNRLSSQLAKVLIPYRTSTVLLASEALGNVLGFVNYFRSGFRFRPKVLREILHQYRRYPIYYLPNSLAGMIFQELPTLFFAAKFSTELAGHYFLFNKVLGQPILLIGNLISSSAMKTSAEMTVYSERISYLKSLAAKIFILFLPVALCTYFLGETLFKLFLGETYGEAGRIASVLFFIIPFRALKGMGVLSTLQSLSLSSLSMLKVASLVILGLYITLYDTRDFISFLIFYSLLEIIFDFLTLKLALRESTN